MCMLIWHPAGAEPFTRDEFVDFHSRNRNGFGVIWRTPRGDVRSKKGLMQVGESWQLYQILRYNGCLAMGLHWRMATAGERFSQENCHPVKVNRNVLLMHNGAHIGPSTMIKSDTVVFAEDRLAPALKQNPDVLYDESVIDKLEHEMHRTNNRLLIWDRCEEEPLIIGEKDGIWWKGRWYSNLYAWSAPDAVRRKIAGWR